MSARAHRSLLFALIFVAFFSPLIPVAIAGPQLGRLLDAIVGALDRVHPLAAFIGFYVLGAAYLIGPALIVSWVMYTLVPARCPKCGNPTYRYDDRGRRVRFLATAGRIRYWCASCRHTEDLGWSEDG